MSNGVVLLKVASCVIGAVVAKQFASTAAGNLVTALDAKAGEVFGWTFFSRSPKPIPPEDKS